MVETEVTARIGRGWRPNSQLSGEPTQNARIGSTDRPPAKDTFQTQLLLGRSGRGGRGGRTGAARSGHEGGKSEAANIGAACRLGHKQLEICLSPAQTSSAAQAESVLVIAKAG